jgi:plastocyanin
MVVDVNRSHTRVAGNGVVRRHFGPIHQIGSEPGEDAMGWARYGMLTLLIVGGVACGADDTSTPEASGMRRTPVAIPPTSPALATPEFTETCPEAKAIDLTDEDPYTITMHNFRFTPDCFIVSLAASSVTENRDDVKHTFIIDGTLVNGSVAPHHTVTHGPSTGFLEPGAYPFYCSIYPRMTGTMIVV